MSVWPAQYRVRVEGSLGEYVRAIRFAGREVTNGIIDTAAGGALEIDVAAARGRLHGRVKGAAGSVTVTLVSEGGRVDQFRELSIVNDDEFTLHNLAPGRYKVYAWQSYQPDLVRSPEFLRTFPATTVEVIDNQQAEIEVGLISTAEIVAGMERF